MTNNDFPSDWDSFRRENEAKLKAENPALYDIQVGGPLANQNMMTELAQRFWARKKEHEQERQAKRVKAAVPAVPAQPPAQQANMPAAEAPVFADAPSEVHEAA